MPKEIEIRCDQCSSDLTYTRNSIGYRLALLNERQAIDPSVRAVADAMRYPPIRTGDAYFCNIDCLAKWLADNHPESFISGYERAQHKR